MKFFLKGFIISHYGEPIKNCQDYYSVSTDKYAFSVTDGATQCLYPTFMSKRLATDYTEDPDNLFESNEGGFVLGKDYSKEYALYCEEEYNKYPDRQGMLDLFKKMVSDDSGATFIGCRLNFDEKCWEYVALGDSCLFFVNKVTGDLTSISSMPNMDFDCSPNYFSAKGNHNGAIVSGSIPLSDGYLLMMTDALSSWFYKTYPTDHSIVEKIFGLNSHEDFKEWRDEKVLNNELGTDDCTLLMLRMEDAENVEDLKMEILHFDRLEDLASAEQEKIREDKVSDAIPMETNDVDICSGQLETSLIVPRNDN